MANELYNGQIEKYMIPYVLTIQQVVGHV
jgi:hypothetical protein